MSKFTKDLYFGSVVGRVAFLMNETEIAASERATRHSRLIDENMKSGIGHIATATSVLIADMGKAIDSLPIIKESQ